MLQFGDQTWLAWLVISGSCFQPAGAPLESLRKGLPVGRPNAVRRRPAPLYRVAPPVALRWRSSVSEMGSGHEVCRTLLLT